MPDTPTRWTNRPALSTLINFLQQQRDWRNTAVIVTWDDFGWLVRPCVYQADQPLVRRRGRPARRARQVWHRDATGRRQGKPVNGRCGPGTRIPFLVISPWVKPNIVTHTRSPRSRWCASSRTTGCTASGLVTDHLMPVLDRSWTVRFCIAAEDRPGLSGSGNRQSGVEATEDAGGGALIARIGRASGGVSAAAARRPAGGRSPWWCEARCPWPRGSRIRGKASCSAGREPVPGAARSPAGRTAVGDGAIGAAGVLRHQPVIIRQAVLRIVPQPLACLWSAGRRPGDDRRPDAGAARAACGAIADVSGAAAEFQRRAGQRRKREHQPAQLAAKSSRRAQGEEDRAGTAQSAANLVPLGGLFWDGRADTLQAQALFPLLSPLEMDGGSIETVAARLRRTPYARSFIQLFGTAVFESPRITVAEALFAVARYQIEDPSFHPYTSKYDAGWKAKRG